MGAAARTAVPAGMRWGGPAWAPLLFAVGAVSQYGGAAVAVALFAVVPAAAVAWIRVAVGAVVLVAWRRPWRRSWTRRRFGLVAAFGLVLAGMNVAFYLAVARLPLGTAVAIEFLGPVLVAAAGTRRWRDAGALLLAVSGVVLLAEVSWSGSAAGVGYALVAAGLWAGYIVLGARVSRTDAAPEGAADGVDALAVGLAVGALALAPVLAVPAAVVVTDPWLALACVAVGVLSTVVPYGIDQLVLRRVTASAFALLQSLLPATAAAIGALVLRQVPTAVEVVGVSLVVGAVAVQALSRR